jgi:hypothetical protein
MKALVVIILSLIFSSCCTKKDCSIENYPNLTIRLPYQKGLVRIVDQNNQQIDSLNFRSGIFRINYAKDVADIRNLSYMVYTNNTLHDSITNIGFEIYEYENKCNQCFLANNAETAIDFRSLTCEVNGRVEVNNLDIVID